MQVTLLGHATILVEAGSAVLMDPWLTPPGQRTMDVCPRRLVHIERLPKLAALVISHAHGDHFDPESLRSLGQQPPVFCADDPRLIQALHDLGFAQVTALAAERPQRVGDLHLHASRSLTEEPEIGVVFETPQALAWNQVDTAVTPSETQRLRRLLNRRLDAAFVSYNPILEHTVMWPEEAEFPQARYERLLENALGARAKVIVPGSSQERFVGERAAFNPRIFPVTVERFASDLRALAPAQRVETLLPGEGLRLTPEAITVIKTGYAEVLEDDRAAIRFDPDAPTAPWPDARLAGVSAAALRSTANALMLHHWPARAQSLLDGDVLGPLRHLADRRHRILVRFWLPDRAAEPLDFDVAWDPVRVRAVRGEAAPTPSTWAYRFEYLASEVHARAMGSLQGGVSVRAFRNRAAAGPLLALEPARLHDIDPYFTVDTTYDWHPLVILA